MSARWVSVLVGLATVAVACGSGDTHDVAVSPNLGSPSATSAVVTAPSSASSGATGSSATTAPLPQTSAQVSPADPAAVEIDTAHCPSQPPGDGPIRIGVNGGGFTINTQLDGLQVVFDTINERGGIDGRPVELVRSVERDSDAPNVDLHLGKLLDRGDLHAIVPWGQVSDATSIGERLHTECVPALFWLLGAAPEHDWVVPGLDDPRAEMAVIAEFVATEVRPRRTLVLSIAVPDQRSIGESALESLRGRGVTASGVVTDPSGSGQFHTEFRDVDAIIITTGGAVCARTLRWAKASYPDATMVVSRWCDVGEEFPAELFEGVIRPGWTAGDHLVEDYGRTRVYETAVVTGHAVEASLESASQLEGGLTRANILRAALSMTLAPPGTVSGLLLRTAWPHDVFANERAAMHVYESRPPSPQEPGWHQLGPVVRADASTPFTPIDRTPVLAVADEEPHCIGPGGGVTVIQTSHWFAEQGQLDPLADIVLTVSGLPVSDDADAQLVATGADGQTLRLELVRGNPAAVCANEAFWDIRRGDAALINDLPQPVRVVFEVHGANSFITEAKLWPDELPPFDTIDLQTVG